MTYQEVKEICKTNSKMIANRPKYKDGWYRLDSRGMWCHYIDLSIRRPDWRKEDLEADDWLVVSQRTLNELNYRCRKYLTNE